MTRRRRPPLERTRRLAAERRREGGPDAGAAMRLAGFGAALLVFVAVGAGFRDSPAAGRIAEAFAVLGPLAEPVFLGASILEWGVIGALALGLAAWGLRARLARRRADRP